MSALQAKQSYYKKHIFVIIGIPKIMPIGKKNQYVFATPKAFYFNKTDFNRVLNFEKLYFRFLNSRKQ